MKALVIVFSLLFPVAAFAADDTTHGNGGCDSYPWDMNREWSIMITDPVPFQALAARAEEARLMPMDRRVRFNMHSAEKVALAATPDKAAEGASFAGMAPMRVPFGKRYRISSSKPVWIDIVGPNGAVAAGKFAMATACKSLVKTVIFKLDIETDYWLQITGSKEDSVDVVVTLDR